MNPSTQRSRFQKAIETFDAANRLDPHQEMADGKPGPRELVYARWLTDWVFRLRADASEELLLAARCQHIERWKIPRQQFPGGRRGYLDWRDALKEYHARRGGDILRALGYPEETILRVQSLNRKEGLGQDPEMQTLEDALCLVFLEKQFHELAQKTERRRMIRALRKSWAKMSEPARQLALQLPYAPEDLALLKEALAEAN